MIYVIRMKYVTENIAIKHPTVLLNVGVTLQVSCKQIVFVLSWHCSNVTDVRPVFTVYRGYANFEVKHR